jgi:hypothetical protein
MSGKNYGPAVSGYLDPTGRNWETTVFQAGKPVLDKELNLTQDIDGGQAEADLRRSMPSGWITSDPLNVAASAPFFVFNPAALTLQLQQGMLAHVNGWLLNIEHTGVINTNTLALTAGPSGAGATRMDLVILEVWRMLLSAAPSTVGKSATGRIWQQGNVKTDPANDATLNFADDIEDSNVNSESTKRVQIQYRLRVIPGVNLFANPYGMTDSAVVANTVPTSALLPDGAATAFTYVNQSPNDDQGLWVAGDGNPANALGTVDGYMYAIPLMGIFRRNTSAWDRILNQNGGNTTPGPSTRPDGYFVDVIEVRDLVDLRSIVSPTGFNYVEVLGRNLNCLLDNSLQSEIATNSFGGGGINGARLPWADEIGPFPSDNAGPLIGNFDAARRRFSGRSILETVTVEIPAPGGTWPATGATITVDPTALAIYPYAAFNWASFAPGAVCIQDFKDAWWIGPSGKKTINAMQYIDSVTNVGAIPAAAMGVNFGNLTGLGLTNESIFIDLVIAYPTAVGLSKTPVNDYGNNSFALTGGTLPATSPTSFSAFANEAFDYTHREVQIEYTTSNLTITQAANSDSGTAAQYSTLVGSTATITGLTGMYEALVGQQITISGSVNGTNNGTFTIVGFVSATSVQITNAAAIVPDAGPLTWTIVTNFARLPERAATLVSISKNGGAAFPATLDTTGRIVNFTSPTTTTSGDYVTITYTALRPIPGQLTSPQMTIYYDAAAPQAARQALLGSSLQVIPRYVPSDLYVITTGAGSQDEAYPWPQGYVQTGGIYPNSTNTYSGESDLSARGLVSVTDFSAATGFLRLPVFIPMVANPDQLTFTGAGTDIEGRSYFNTVPGGTYIPNAYAQELSNAKRHKNFLPMLCELAVDGPLGFKGQLVLVLLLRYGLFDAADSVNFNADLTQNTTVASVFRLKGNLLNKRAT